MKLTQKTLFQCFDKSQRQSPIILDETDEGISFLKRLNDEFNDFSILEIIECELPSSDPQESQSHQPDFLLPIHIRQEEKSLQNSILPLLNQWKLIESNDDLSSSHLENFYRICPTVNNPQINSPTLQVNYHISLFSSSRSLFSIQVHSYLIY